MPYYPGAGQIWSKYYQHSQLTQSNVPPPLTLTNNFRNGVPGNTISAAGSGGIAGNAFNTVSVGSGGTLAYSSVQTVHGLPVSLLAQTTTANATDFGWSTTALGPLQFQIWFCQYLLFPSLPTASTRLYTTSAAGIAGGTSRIVATTAGTVQIQNAAGSGVGTTTNSIPIGQWFRLEGYTQSGQGNGLIEVKIFTNLDDVIPLETKTTALTDAGPNINNTLFGPNAGTANQGPLYIGFVGVSNQGYMGTANFPTLIPQLEAFPGPTWQKNYQHRQVTYLTTPDVNIGPPPANVNVAGLPDNSLAIYQTFTPPFPELPVLPPSMMFNASYIALRPQVVTSYAGVFTPGSAANVSVFGQSDNTVTALVSGTTSGVNVSGQSDNTITESMPGAAANVSVASQAGTIVSSVIASVANVNVAGIAGSITESMSGVAGLVNVAAIPGILVQPPVNITGSPASVSVMAPSGTVFKEPDGTWWRVYPAYRSYPT